MTAQTLLTRADVPVELTWDLSRIYESDEHWEKDFLLASERVSKLDQFHGKLTESAQIILSALELRDELSQSVDKLYVYAHLRADEDTSQSFYQALQERARTLYIKLSTALSFMEPELLSMEEDRLRSFIDSDKALGAYRHELEELLRQKAHIKSREVEEVLAQAGQLYSGPGQVYSMLSNADLTLPNIEDENGKETRLTQGNFAAQFLDSNDRPTRERAYRAMFETYSGFRNTLAANYSSHVNSGIFQAKVRGYKSVRHMKLDGINVPESVYDTLLETVSANLPKMQRYLDLRKKLLGLDDLCWYDLYVPLVKGGKEEIEYGQACRKVLESLSVLGDDYVNTLAKGFDERWVDVLESKGKRSGAYSSGCYGTAPYMLLNWQSTIDSLFTLAHEAGHSMHSFYARNTQPYHYSGYTIFVAEVASTCNEALLAHYLLATTEDIKARRYIINHQLESIRLTLVRQTLFAEFEKLAHEHAEKGDALTADLLCRIHLELNRKYYSPVVEIDDLLGNEWSRIPHFYSSFYVYQYATGISAALALSRQILEEGEPAVRRYLEFLSSGCSKYSIDLLKDAGVDLSTPEPIEKAFRLFETYLDEFETLI